MYSLKFSVFIGGVLLAVFVPPRAFMIVGLTNRLTLTSSPHLKVGDSQG